jgi:hypothetical protein
MRTCARILMLAAVLGTGGCMNLSQPFAPMHPRWHDYSSIQSRHAVDFPGKARQSLKETKIVSGQTVSTYLLELQSGDRYYGTAWTLVPGAHSGTRPQVNPLLEIAADEALKSAPGAKFIDRRPIAIDGHTGLAYVVDLPQAKTRLRQQIFMVTGVLVEQTYTGPAGTETERDAGRFFDSLKLLP